MAVAVARTGATKSGTVADVILGIVTPLELNDVAICSEMILMHQDQEGDESIDLVSGETLMDAVRTCIRLIVFFLEFSRYRSLFALSASISFIYLFHCDYSAFY